MCVALQPRASSESGQGDVCGVMWLLSMTSNSAVRALSLSTLTCLCRRLPPSSSLSLFPSRVPPPCRDSPPGCSGPGRTRALLGEGSGRPRGNPRGLTSFLCVTIQTCPYAVATRATFSSQLLVPREHPAYQESIQRMRWLSRATRASFRTAMPEG